MEPVTHINRLKKSNSLLQQGKCDEVFESLITDLGWKDEFDQHVSAIKEGQAKL